MPTIRLHPHQAEDAHALAKHFAEPYPECGGGRDAGAYYCTGGGKTILGSALAAMAKMPPGGTPAPGHYTHWMYSAPTNVIADSFYMPGVTGFSDGKTTYSAVPVRKDVSIGDYLALENPGFAINPSHADVRNFLPHLRLRLERDPQMCRGKMNWLDEGHHAAVGNQLREFHDAWLLAGGDATWSTATPWDRDDGRATIGRDKFHVRRTIAEQMAEDYAPRTILSEMLTIECESYEDSEDVAVPVPPEPVADRLVTHMRADEWPKAIVRVKNQRNTGLNRAAIRASLRALRAVGQRVYVASETHERDAEIERSNGEIIRDLRARARQFGWTDIEPTSDLAEVRAFEKRVTRYDQSCVDVIIGIQEIVEGFDWPLCSHAYLIGIPRGLLPVIQVLGRTVRSKLAHASDLLVPAYVGYPTRWQSFSKLVFITAPDPKAKDALLAQMLETCGYLSSFQQSVVLGSFRRLLKRLKIDAEEQAAAAAKIRTFTLTEEQANEIECAWNESRRILDATTTRLSHDYSWSDKIKITLIYLGVKNGWTPEQVQQNTELREQVRQHILLNNPNVQRRISELPDRPLPPGRDIADGFKKSLRQILDEFEEDVSVPALTVADKMVLALSGPGINKWGARVVPAASVPKSGAKDPYSAIQDMLEGR
jgi:hypothetical protein